MATKRNFGVFILTHGRANNIKTDKALRARDYTGDIHYVIDDEDDQQQDYIEKYGADNVHIFSKTEEEKHFDPGDLSTDRRTIVYARNASQRIAKDLGYTHILQLDDDYTSFSPRIVSGIELLEPFTGRLDDIFSAFCDFLDETKAQTVAMAQGGDFIGGAASTRYWQGITRKAMNTFFINTNNPIQFQGRINEDVNTYVQQGNTGTLFFTISKYAIVQTTTQSNQGGMTDTYKATGTYLKTFHTIMRNPSSTKVGIIQATNQPRIHHSISWKHTTPMILNPQHKKTYNETKQRK